MFIVLNKKIKSTKYSKTFFFFPLGAVPIFPIFFLACTLSIYFFEFKTMATIVRDMPDMPPAEGRMAKDEEFARKLQAEYDVAAVEAPSSEMNDAANTSAATNCAGNLNHRLDNGRVATASNPWEFDAAQNHCTCCKDEFNPFNRKHHCRLCGKIYCNKCTQRKSLVPPSSIVLTPIGGKKVSAQSQVQHASFSPDPVCKFDRKKYIAM